MADRRAVHRWKLIIKINLQLDAWTYSEQRTYALILNSKYNRNYLYALAAILITRFYTSFVTAPARRSTYLSNLRRVYCHWIFIVTRNVAHLRSTNGCNELAQYRIYISRLYVFASNAIFAASRAHAVVNGRELMGFWREFRSKLDFSGFNFILGRNLESRKFYWVFRSQLQDICRWCYTKASEMEMYNFALRSAGGLWDFLRSWERPWRWQFFSFETNNSF